jgi:hypothetical protein
LIFSFSLFEFSYFAFDYADYYAISAAAFAATPALPAGLRCHFAIISLLMMPRYD